jgi:hypothetical protein
MKLNDVRRFGHQYTGKMDITRIKLLVLKDILIIVCNLSNEERISPDRDKAS